MCKKIVTMMLCLVLVLSMAACGITQASIDATENTQNIVPEQTDPATPSEADSNTPEEVAKQFYLALAQKDIDTMVELTPQYSYDAIAYVLNIPIEDGLTGKAAAKAAYEFAFQDGGSLLEVEFESIEVTTRLTPEADIPGDILQGIREGYVDHEMMTQQTFDSIEDTAWVDVAYTIVMADGSQEHQDYGEVRLICVKVDGKWYMDFIMVMCMPARGGSAEVHRESIG